MILEILLICVFCLLFAVGAIWFALRTVRIAIREGKPNITINFDQSDKKPEINKIPEFLRNINLLLNSKKILKIEQKSKDDEV